MINPEQFEAIERNREAMEFMEKENLTFCEFADGFVIGETRLTPALDDENRLCYEWRKLNNAGYSRTIMGARIDSENTASLKVFSIESGGMSWCSAVGSKFVGLVYDTVTDNTDLNVIFYADSFINDTPINSYNDLLQAVADHGE